MGYPNTAPLLVVKAEIYDAGGTDDKVFIAELSIYVVSYCVFHAKNWMV